MKGRGLLGRWGPNHAVDPIVSRWQRDARGKKIMMGGKPVLEFVAIKRKDTGDWAIPGVRNNAALQVTQYCSPNTNQCISVCPVRMKGMVDPGDTVSRTLRKEFGEEAMNSLEASLEEKKQIEKQINELFKEGHRVSHVCVCVCVCV